MFQPTHRTIRDFRALHLKELRDLFVQVLTLGRKMGLSKLGTHAHTAAMAAKLQTDEGKAVCRRRKWLAEPPNGWIKSVLGFRQFSLRGPHRGQAEFRPVCLSLNLRRMATMQA